MDIQQDLSQILGKFVSTEPGRLTCSIESGSEAFSSELTDLRRLVYAGEKGWLREDHLYDANDEISKHILLRRDGELVGALAYFPAEEGDFAMQTGIEAESLKDAIVTTRNLVHPKHRNQGYMSLLVYLAMREARLMGRTRYVGYVETGMSATRHVMGYQRIPNTPVRTVVAGTNSYELEAVEGLVSEVAIRTFDHLKGESLELARASFVKDITSQVIKRVRELYASNFFLAVAERRLSKIQYIDTLYNQHQFVRWTTRILGRAIGSCDIPELRHHYCSHLSGEINHEVWIENDLRHLGVDTTFLKQKHVAHEAIMSFMFTQEAMTTSRQDAVHFLAVPIAIEGATAFLTQTFVDDLRACVRNWGYTEASKATTFLASHVHTDGDEIDGHWIHTLEQMADMIKDESSMQYVLALIDTVLINLTRAYNSFATRSTIELQ